MAEIDINRYRSRTLWMIVGLTLLTALFCWHDKIDGTGWLTFLGVLFSGWQIRRFKDNELRTNGGK